MLKLTVKQIKDRILLVENQSVPEYGSPKERMEWYKQDQAYLRTLYKLLKERKAEGNQEYLEADYESAMESQAYSNTIWGDAEDDNRY